ncbi:hypothetical protein J6590_068464 [Homalodisca vitripennis]|nr:hypothetical protein J6590_068464 [Homalodisca vitripennis]
MANGVVRVTLRTHAHRPSSIVLGEQLCRTSAPSSLSPCLSSLGPKISTIISTSGEGSCLADHLRDQRPNVKLKPATREYHRLATPYTTPVEADPSP